MMPATKKAVAPPMESTKRVSLRDVWAFSWKEIITPNSKLISGWMLVSAVGIFPSLIVIQLISTITSTLQGKDGGTGSIGTSWWYFFAWAGLILVVAPLMVVAEKLLSSRIDQQVSTHLRVRTFDAILAKPLPFYHQQSQGGLLFLLREMCIECQIAVRQLTIDAVVNIIRLLGALGFVLYNLLGNGNGAGNLLTVTILLALGLISPFLVGKFAKRFQTMAAGLRDANMTIAGMLEGSIKSPEEIKAFSAESWLSAKYKGLLKTLNVAREEQTLTVTKANFINTLPSEIVQVLLVGAALVAATASTGTNSAGTLVAVMLLAPKLMQPLQGFSNISMTFNQSQPSLQRIMELLETAPPAEALPKNERPQLSALPGAGSVKVSLKGVHFAYPGAKKPVMNGVNLDIPSNKVTALVARMGEGKSTLFRLLMRFYEPDKGSFELDGVPITDIPLNELRHRIGFMAQFPTFTHDSVRENFLLADQDSTDEEIIKVCKDVGLLGILEEKLPNPQNSTNILDRPFSSGMTLSGGQRKLFALARCLLRSPEVILLDEPTTGVDNENKNELLKVMREAFKGRTVIIIDHDVQWLAGCSGDEQDMDKILCDQFAILEQGVISNMGDFDTVKKSNALFDGLLRRDFE